LDFSARRTFAIISHPDAGKTTLTEKLLLFGGAIRMAGQVKARANRRLAQSDWMQIEQARGISVTTSVMTFDYADTVFNLLDTPGHQDFSEDTYRTLTAVDGAIMVIDAAKGIEAQTLKLFEVCRMRDIPIMTFVNKMDREARDPFDLMDEIADKLALETAPVTWPVGTGRDFKGCYDLVRDEMIVFEDNPKEKLPEIMECQGLDDPTLQMYMTPEQHTQLKEEAGLVRGAGTQMNLQSYREGHLTPVYFGSALKNFGIRELINGLIAYAPPPRAQHAVSRTVTPDEDKVSGFVFKVQANMDPNHRDRVAFFRLCSGSFKRGMRLHHVRTGKPMGIHSPIFFFSQGRELAEEAIAGDIIGIPNHGTLRVGDTLTEGEDLVFTGIPNFAPEILRRVVLKDSLKAKHLKKALESLAEEGVTQVFRSTFGSDWLVGVVGALQLDVMISRLQIEYGLDVRFEETIYHTARWVTCDDAAKLENFMATHRMGTALDRDGAPVFLPRNAWDLDHTQKNNPGLVFSKIKERGV
jgi:peptide chain release factor 3